MFGGNRQTDSIVVTRRALTISVEIDTSRLAAKNGESPLAGGVTLIQELRHRSSWLRLTFTKPLSSTTYGSALRPIGCHTLTDVYSCRDSSAVEIVNGRIVITVRDSAMLALLFASRPTEASLIHSAMRFPGSARLPVRYADPQLVPPSKEALAEYDRVLGREGWSPWMRMMSTASYGISDTAWMQVGERTTATVSEYQGRPVDDSNWRWDFSSSGWSLSDSSVVALAPSTEPDISVSVVALRPGRSTITAHGLRGPSDDLPRSTRVRTVSRDIVVINRLARIAITPRPTTIVAGSRFSLAARAIDESGAVVADAPVRFYVIYDIPDKFGWDGKRSGLAADVDLRTPGRRRFIAQFAKFADTLDVEVVPGKPPL